jgi:hypothetical protein
MEFGIFDFSKVFSRAFGEEGDGASGDLEWMPGDVVTDYRTSLLLKSGVSEKPLVDSIS